MPLFYPLIQLITTDLAVTPSTAFVKIVSSGYLSKEDSFVMEIS